MVDQNFSTSTKRFKRLNNLVTKGSVAALSSTFIDKYIEDKIVEQYSPHITDSYDAVVVRMLVQDRLSEVKHFLTTL